MCKSCLCGSRRREPYDRARSCNGWQVGPRYGSRLLRAGHHDSGARYRQSAGWSAGVRLAVGHTTVSVYAHSTANPAQPGSGKYPADGA